MSICWTKYLDHLYLTWIKISSHRIIFDVYQLRSGSKHRHVSRWMLIWTWILQCLEKFLSFSFTMNTEHVLPRWSWKVSHEWSSACLTAATDDLKPTIYYIDTSEIPSELKCKHMKSSHVKRTLLVWLHIKTHLLRQEGYPSTHTFLLFFIDIFTRQLGLPWREGN